jgi:DNA-binding NarL/FixJ family response regulator
MDSGDSGMPSAENIAVLVVEDDSIVRSWVRLSLRGTELRVAGEAGSAQEAEELVGRRHCDVLLVDQHLPDRLGTELVRRLRRTGVELPVVLMTASAEEGLNETAREAGVQASVVKSSDPERLIEVIRSVLAGEGVFDVAHPRRPKGQATLAPREQETLALIAAGRTNREAAAQLGISDETVKTLLERAYAKLGVRRRAEAVLEARRRGLV